MANRIQLRRGTAAHWASTNPVLGDGEPGIEKDTGKQKFGNGIDVWTALPYASEGPQGPAGVADDASVAAIIEDTGSETAGVLSATYAPASGSANYATPAAVTAAVEPKLDASVAAATYATSADVTAQVPGEVAEVLAGDGTIIAAAEAAVSTAAAGLELVEGLAVDDPEYAIAFGDESRFAAGGVLMDGSTQFVRLLHQAESVPAAALGPDVGIEAVSDFEFAVPFTDNDGYVAGGLRHDGTFAFTGGVELPDPTTDEIVAAANQYATLTRSDRYRVACVGDSLTDGYDGTTSYWPDTDAWPYKMGQLLPSFVTVFNRGESGQTVDEISIRLGALPLVCTVAGGEIPASGPVSVTIPAGVGWRPDRTWDFLGSLAGVPGTLTRTTTATTTLTFTRTTPGTAVTVAAPATFVSAQDVHREDTVVIFAGRNDVAYSVAGADGTIANHVVLSTIRLVNHLTPQVKQVLLVGTTTSTSEPSGTSGYNTVVSINEQLAALYPGKFFDLRHYLVAQAIYDLGITPDATDLTKIAGDTLPPSIMVSGDSIHYSKATATLVAAQIYKQLTSRRWA